MHRAVENLKTFASTESRMRLPARVAVLCAATQRFHAATQIVPRTTPCAMCTTPAVPLSAVGLDGGDVNAGLRVTREQIRTTVDEACSTVVTSPIIAYGAAALEPPCSASASLLLQPRGLSGAARSSMCLRRQYYPERRWLWRQWRGTIVRRTLPREVFANILFAAVLSVTLRSSMPGAAWLATMAESYLAGVAKVWALTATMASFTLSFFLSQSYALWRSVYKVTRRVQGRLNDVGMLCATFAERDPSTGEYTARAALLLQTVARYVRLFNMLFCKRASRPALACAGDGKPCAPPAHGLAHAPSYMQHGLCV